MKAQMAPGCQLSSLLAGWGWNGGKVKNIVTGFLHLRYCQRKKQHPVPTEKEGVKQHSEGGKPEEDTKHESNGNSCALIFPAGLTHSRDGLGVFHTHLYSVSFCLGLLLANKHSSRSLPTATAINWYYPANELQAVARSMTTAPLPRGQEWHSWLTSHSCTGHSRSRCWFLFSVCRGHGAVGDRQPVRIQKKNHIKHRTTQFSKTVSAAVWPALHVEFSVISTLAPGRFFFPYLAPTNPPVGAEMHSAGAEQFSLCGELTDKHVPAEERGSAAPEGCWANPPHPRARQSRELPTAWPKLRADSNSAAELTKVLIVHAWGC